MLVNNISTSNAIFHISNDTFSTKAYGIKTNFKKLFRGVDFLVFIILMSEFKRHLVHYFFLRIHLVNFRNILNHTIHNIHNRSERESENKLIFPQDKNMY